LSTSRCIRNATLTSDYTIPSYLDAPSEPFCAAPITDPRSRKVVGVIMATQKKSGATVGGWGWGGAHEGEQGFTSEDEELLRCFGLAAGVLMQKVEAIEKTTIQNQKMKDAVELALKLSSTKTFKELFTCLEKSLPHVVETPAVRLFWSTASTSIASSDLLTARGWLLMSSEASQGRCSTTVAKCVCPRPMPTTDLTQVSILMCPWECLWCPSS